MADSTAVAFWSDGYRTVDDLLSLEQCAFIRQAMETSRAEGQMREATTRVYSGPHNQYAPLPGQMILASLAPVLSKLVDRTLLPSYAFWRIYEQGDVLNPHKDRNSCEVSVTIAIASELGDPAWPICVTDLHGGDHKIALNAGAGLLYQGTEIKHWREPLPGERQFQLFLHYVVEGGSFAALANDRGLSKAPQMFAEP